MTYNVVTTTRRTHARQGYSTYDDREYFRDVVEERIHAALIGRTSAIPKIIYQKSTVYGKQIYFIIMFSIAKIVIISLKSKKKLYSKTHTDISVFKY